MGRGGVHVKLIQERILWHMVFEKAIETAGVEHRELRPANVAPAIFACFQGKSASCYFTKVIVINTGFQKYSKTLRPKQTILQFRFVYV